MPDLEIRADVPVTIHPSVLNPHSDVLEDKAAALDSAKATLGDAYKFISDVNDAETALQAVSQSKAPAKRRQLPTGQSEFLGDLRLAPGKGLKQFSGLEDELLEAAGQRLEAVTRRIDRTAASLTETAERLDQTINFALTDPDVKTPNGIAMATEIRAHLKGLPDKERFGFLQNAIKAGDLPTISAALNAAPFLSGLKPEEQGAARVLAAKTFAAKAVAQREAVGRLLSSVEHAGAEVLKRFTEIQKGADNPRAKANRKLAELKKGAV